MHRSAAPGRGLRTAAALTLLVATGISAAPSPAAAQSRDPRIVAALSAISPDSLAAYTSRLRSFGTRLLLSEDRPKGQGIVAAREWIHDRMAASSPRLNVSYDCYDLAKQGRVVRPVKLCNVMAVLPGRSDRRIYVSGHYDSVARVEGQGFDWGRSDNPAPGVNDDGSGTALTMELARVLAQSGMQFDATLVFIAFAGEEEGLIGASAHAQTAKAKGVRIDGVFNNDITGNSIGGSGQVDSWTLRVFSEDPMDSPSREMARYIRRWGAVYEPQQRVRLIAREDRFGRGGDHTAFNGVGYPGVRISESKEDYSRQHTVHDTLIDPQYLARNARVDGGAVATVALAPPAPDVMSERGYPRLGRGEDGYTATLEWAKSPGAVGYRVVWRDAWTPDWQYELRVGDVDSAALPGVSVDDYIFGVAAVDAEGHESFVSAYVRPPRAFREVELAK